MCADRDDPGAGCPDAGLSQPKLSNSSPEAAELYRSLIMAMAEGVVLQDATGQLYACNPSAERILGLTHEQLMGRTSLDPRWRAIHEDGSPFPGETHPSMVTLRTGRPCSNLVMGIHKPDGALTWISVNTQPLFRPGETNPYAVLSSFADITERKKAEIALRQAEERFSLAFLSSPEGLTITTLDQGRYLEANNAFLQLIGYSRSELLGKTASQLQIWADPQQRLSLLDQLRSSSGVVEIEVKFRAKSGAILDVRFAAVTIQLQNEPCILAMTRDVTAAKRIERDLRFSEERFAKAFRCSPDAMSIATFSEGRILEANDAFVQLTGYSRQELLQHTADELNLWLNVEDRRGMLARLRSHGGIRGYEAAFRTRDGKPRMCQISSELIDVAGQNAILAVIRDVTDSRQATEQIRISAAILNRVPCIVLVLDTDGNITYANPFLETALGYKPDEVMGDRWWTLTREDPREAAREKEYAMLAARGAVPVHPTPYERRVKHRDGSDRSILWVDTVQKGKFLVGVGQDVTDLQEARRSLARSEERFRTAFEHAAIGMAIADPAGRFLTANSKFCDITGYSPDQLLQLKFQSITHPDDLALNEDLLQRMLDGEIPSFVIEKRYVTAQGTVTWVTNSVSLLRDRAGAPLSMITLAEDITERKKAEQALAENARQWQALFDGAQDAIVIVDNACRFVQANPAARALFHLPSAEFSGRGLCEFFAPADQPVFSRFVVQGSGRRQFPIVAPGNKRLVVDVAANSNFLPGRHLCVLRDVTEQRDTERKLRQAQKMEAVGRLAGGVAHDFNNLLGVILGYAELITDQLPASSPLIKRVDEIRKAGNHAASLTRQLLAFSRQQVLQPVTLSLNSTVSHVEKMLRRLIGEDVRLTISLCPDLKPVNADQGQIEQILLNLAVNARDAMPKGGELTISTGNAQVDDAAASSRPGLRCGAYSVLSVSDTGMGMEPSVQAHIFEPFFTTKEVGRGTGLGLATVYGIVKQSEGYIDVTSSLGQGTRFDVYLPQAEDILAARDRSEGGAPTLKGSETLLLVEDAAPLRSVTQEFLASCGYNVLAAADASEALQLASHHSGAIHLLVTDVVMPGMSGRVLAEALASARPAIKVLYLSGYTDDVIVRHGVLQEGIAILPKPYSKHALAAKVRQVLDGIHPSLSKATGASR